MESGSCGWINNSVVIRFHLALAIGTVDVFSPAVLPLGRVITGGRNLVAVVVVVVIVVLVDLALSLANRVSYAFSKASCMTATQPRFSFLYPRRRRGLVKEVTM